MQAFLCSQFHLLFYSSRLLPNTLAQGMVLQGLAEWVLAPLQEVPAPPSSPAPTAPEPQVTFSDQVETALEGQPSASVPSSAYPAMQPAPLERADSTRSAAGGVSQLSMRGTNVPLTAHGTTCTTDSTASTLPYDTTRDSTLSLPGAVPLVRASSNDGIASLRAQAECSAALHASGTGQASTPRSLRRAQRKWGKLRAALVLRAIYTGVQGKRTDTLAKLWQGAQEWMWWGSSPGLWRACAWLTAATVWFRCDILVLLVPVLAIMLWRREVSFLPLVVKGLTLGCLALVPTVLVDSALWRTWLWPEGVVFFFNAVQGGSSKWGTSPWYWYATSALPRALLWALPLSFGGVLTWVNAPGVRPVWHPALPYTLAGLAFVALYSCQPHKELRFLFPALPLLNLGAGMAAHGLWHVGRRDFGCWGWQPRPAAERPAAEVEQVVEGGEAKEAEAVVEAQAAAGGDDTAEAASQEAPPTAQQAAAPGPVQSEEGDEGAWLDTPGDIRASPLRKDTGSLQLVVRAGLLCCLASHVLVTGVLALAASGNYPGGHALQAVHAHFDASWATANATQDAALTLSKLTGHRRPAHVPGGLQPHPALQALLQSVGGSMSLPPTPAPHWPYETFSFWNPPEEDWFVWDTPVTTATPSERGRPIRVHLCTLAATTGSSRFGQRGWPWMYSKNESSALGAATPDEWAAKFDYIVTEDPLWFLGASADHNLMSMEVDDPVGAAATAAAVEAKAALGGHATTSSLFYVTAVIPGLDLSGIGSRSALHALSRLQALLVGQGQRHSFLDRLLDLRAVGMRPKLWVLANQATVPQHLVPATPPTALSDAVTH